MEDHQFIDAPMPPQHILYSLVFSDETHDIIPLSTPALFDSHARNGYTIQPEDIVAYRNALAAAEEEPQEWGAQVPPP